MKSHLAYLLLGSNLGDKMLHLKHAVSSIESAIGNVQVLSSFYETEPWGVSDQPNYLNAAISIRTNLSPEELLFKLKQLERDEGRTSLKKYASRPIDVDILFYDDLIFNSPDLTIPHPKLHLRRFALTPLAEIASDFVHPVFNKSIVKLLDECPDHLQVDKVGP